MVRGMQLTFLGTRDASGEACLNGRPDDRRVGGRPARQDGRGGSTHIGAVQASPYALGQRDNIGLRHAGIGTSGTCLKAGDALLYALDQCVVEDRSGTRMGVTHLSDDQGHERSFRCHACAWRLRGGSFTETSAAVKATSSVVGPPRTCRSGTVRGGGCRGLHPVRRPGPRLGSARRAGLSRGPGFPAP